MARPLHARPFHTARRVLAVGAWMAIATTWGLPHYYPPPKYIYLVESDAERYRIEDTGRGGAIAYHVGVGAADATLGKIDGPMLGEITPFA